MFDIIKTEATLHAQAILIRGAFSSLNCCNFVVLDLIGDLTTYTAVGTYTVDFIH